MCGHLICAGHCVARAAMPSGMYRTAQPYRALLVLGSAALLAPTLAETLFWFLRIAFPHVIGRDLPGIEHVLHFELHCIVLP